MPKARKPRRPYLWQCRDGYLTVFGWSPDLTRSKASAIRFPSKFFNEAGLLARFPNKDWSKEFVDEPLPS